MNTGQFKKGEPAWNKGVKNSTGFQKSRFKKGCIPWHTRTIYDERADTEGFIYIKVSHNKWRLKSRWLYEQYHGDIPLNSVIRYWDGNKKNVTIENLFCVTRRENAYLCRIRFHLEPLALRPVILMMAKLHLRIKALTQ